MKSSFEYFALLTTGIALMMSTVQETCDAFRPSVMSFQRTTVPELVSPPVEFLLRSTIQSLAHRTIGLSRGSAKQRQPPIVYKHLFRHYGDISFDSWLRCQEPKDFLLSVGYTQEEIELLLEDFPALLNQNVHSQLAPLVRFLVETLEGGTGQLTWTNDKNEKNQQLYSQHYVNETVHQDECQLFEDSDASNHHSMRLWDSTKALVKGRYYASQLDRRTGPYHAYLEANQLPHGKTLLQQPELWDQFVTACSAKTIESVVSMCQEWSGSTVHSQSSIERFCQQFSPGIIPAAKVLPLSPPSSQKNKSGWIPLMLKHGANPLEEDKHGVSPLFWAAGRSNVAGFQSLVKSISKEHDYGEVIHDLLDMEREPKDGATALHWACCGVNKTYIGIGGSFDICQWILKYAGEDAQLVVNMETMNTKSSPLMWAAWGGNLAIVDLLVIHGANLLHMDNNGRNALHWAAAGGHADVVDYLLHARSVEDDSFRCKCDNDGWTPSDYAHLYGRTEVEDLMREYHVFSQRPQSDVVPV
jgi:Ankyrin repeats (3 copies)